MTSPMTSGIHGKDSDSLGLKTLVSRTSFIVNSPEISDIKFVFKNVSGTGSRNGHSQGQGAEEIIYGHKLILALASPVFHRIFYLDKQNEQFVTTAHAEIHMDDCGFTAEAFLEFIRFLYTDKIDYETLKLELIVGIFSCADYYDVPCLKKDCANQLEKMITTENVFRIMEIAETFREPDLVIKTLEFLDQNLESLVESEVILCIKLETLFELVKRDSLDIDESFVLDLALKWAGKECERKNREPTGENKREVLGKVFFEIRFGLLSSDRISELIRSNLLIRDESLDIVLDVHTPGYGTTTANSKRLRLAPKVVFKSNPRIFGQKKKLMEVQEIEEKLKERDNFEYLKSMARSLANARANLIMRGFPGEKIAYDLRDEIERARPLFDLYVYCMDPNGGVFHVEFKYNSAQYDLNDLLDPAWYEFDNPSSIQISNWTDNDDWTL